jgi:hypothetical protein
MATRAEIKASIAFLFREYNEAIRQGRELENEAARVRMEAYAARDDVRRMKSENRERRGHSGNPTAGQANDDVRFASFAVAKEGIGDNKWFLGHSAIAAEATMKYAKATAIMGALQYEMAKLNIMAIGGTSVKV